MVNPHARSLTFADTTVRTRRDHVKYLTLIAAVTLLHQHQREIRTVTRGGQVIRYVETAPADIALADRLAAAVLSRRWMSCRPAPAVFSTPSPVTWPGGVRPRAWTPASCGLPAASSANPCRSVTRS